MWKVQLLGIKGWYDLRESQGNGDIYKTCEFDTKEKAQSEANATSGIFEEESRVVSSDTPEDWSPYC